MYKVLDGCYSGSDVIRFLRRSDQNRIIVTEQLLTETFKAGSAIQARKAFSCFENFESQVLLTKSTSLVVSATPTKNGLRKRYIDNKETKKFIELLDKLGNDCLSTSDFNDLIKNNASIAQNKLLPYRQIAEDVIKNIDFLTGEFSVLELKQLRSKRGASENEVRKILDTILKLACESHMEWSKKSARQVMQYDLFFSFHYRWALCTYLNYITKIKDGALETLKPNKLVNDLIDMEQAAWGTIYDGVISKDKNLNSVFSMADWIVNLIKDKAIYKS